MDVESSTARILAIYSLLIRQTQNIAEPQHLSGIAKCLRWAPLPLECHALPLRCLAEGNEGLQGGGIDTLHLIGINNDRLPLLQGSLQTCVQITHVADIQITIQHDADRCWAGGFIAVALGLRLAAMTFVFWC